jgi:hypothetical protein
MFTETTALGGNPAPEIVTGDPGDNLSEENERELFEPVTLKVV